MLAIPFMQISAPSVEAALDTSPRSFAAFYDQALPRVHGYFFYRCGGSARVAEDLTQERFLAAVVERGAAASMCPGRTDRTHGLMDA
jgi:DNA-directed RNA polymerase specialized sigma24 family protein